MTKKKNSAADITPIQKRFLILLAILGTVGLGFWILSSQYQSQQSPTSPQSTTPLSQDGDWRKQLLRETAPSIGNPSAPVTMVEFLDPECESCRAMHPIVKQILAEYRDQLYFVIRYMPFHHNSALAAGVLEAARLQDLYWQTLDVLFETQPLWGDHGNPRPDRIFEFIAKLPLNMEKLKADIRDEQFIEWIRQDQNDGIRAGVTATPTFFVNGKKLREIGYGPLKQAIDIELKKIVR